MNRKTLSAFALKTIRLGVAVSFAALVFSAATPSAPAQMMMPRQIYGDPGQAHAEVKEALAKAAREHKHVILDFGGNWCGDCQVLDIYFHQEPNASLLRDNFVLVDINIGHMDENLDLPQQYGVPLKRGVPALAVLDSHGRLLYSQKTGEFETMRRMEASSVTDFLTKWKPAR
jgi:thiol:disulfide interchange protein